MIIQSLRKYYFYGDAYQYEFPTGSGRKLNLKEIANELSKRLIKLFERNGNFSIMLMITIMFSQMKSSSKPTFFYEFF
jgi:hypothetical protein